MSLEKFIKDHKDAFDDEKMPVQADLKFKSRLTAELHHSTRVRQLKTRRLIAIAASFIVFVALGFLYNENRKDQLEIRDNLVLALDENQTNSTQLEAIYEIEDRYDNQKEDKKILDAFFKILEGDSNSNSKLAVIDALLKFPDNPLVRDHIIEALANEKEPLVQLKLIKSVTILREQRAKASLQKIIENNESLPLVKGNASVTLAMLNQ